jgi:CCR4-NOT transcription complex subunit 6
VLIPYLFLEEFTGTLDYMFYTPNTLDVTKILQLPSEQEMKEIGTLPNVDFPSDHLPLCAEFTFKSKVGTSAGNK